LRAFAPEGGNCARMSEEKRRLFPHLGNQLVKIVGCRRTVSGGDSHPRRDIGQNAVIRVEDELALLALLDLFDQQAKLFLDLIVRLVIEIGDAGLDIENGRDRVQEIFAPV
jgi:hypothetical protein